MGVDTEILGNHGPKHSITHDGVVYHVRLIDQWAKAEWEQRLYDRAIHAARVISKRHPKGWLEDKLVKIDDDFINGEFAFFTEKSLKLIMTPPGVELLLTILTGKDLAELAPMIIAKPEEVKAVLHMVIKESFPGVKLEKAKEDSHPN